MIPVCLYFQVHQPYRLRRYNYFDVGREHRYFDDDRQPRAAARASPSGATCRRPRCSSGCSSATRASPSSFSLSGCLLEQLAGLGARGAATPSGASRDTGRVEFLAETSHHSLAWLASPRRVRGAGRAPPAPVVEELGPEPARLPQHRAHLLRRARGLPRGARLPRRARRRRRAARSAPRLAPTTSTARPTPPGLPLLLRDYRLSDDIAFRFSNRAWSEWPLTAEKYDRWIARPARRRPVALHGLRDLRRAPVEGDRHLRVLRGLGRPAPGAARRRLPDAVAGDRDACPAATPSRRRARSPGPTRRATSRPGRATTSRRTR